MKESAARLLVEGLKEAGIEVVACLPEGLLKPLYVHTVAPVVMLMP